jgi:hypothetical protein
LLHLRVWGYCIGSRNVGIIMIFQPVVQDVTRYSSQDGCRTTDGWKHNKYLAVKCRLFACIPNEFIHSYSPLLKTIQGWSLRVNFENASHKEFRPMGIVTNS